MTVAAWVLGGTTAFFLVLCVWLIRVVLAQANEETDRAKFYHEAGKSAAQHELDFLKLQVEKKEAEAREAEAYAKLAEDERARAREGLPASKFGDRIPTGSQRAGGRRTVINPTGGPDD